MKRKHPKQRHSVILMLLILAFAITAFAHPGRTDSKGGHYDRQNGGYHYHHGYDEHQHPNGVCPYEYDYDYDSTKSNTNNKTRYTETNYEFLGKLSVSHDWHISDVINIIILISSPVVIFIIISDFKKQKFRNYGDLIFTILISLFLCGFSLSVIFPYSKSGLDFLWDWFFNGIIVPACALFATTYPLVFIHSLLSCLNFNDKKDKK